MNLLKKKESIYFNIALTALLCALNVIFVFITRFLPLSFFIFMIVLPSISTIEAILCKKIYFIPYFLVSGTLCFLVNIAEISNTLFYIFPSLIIGFIIGECFILKINIAYTFIVSSLMQLLLSYVTLYLVYAIYQIDIINVFVTAFNLTNFKYLNEITPIFMLFMASAQVALALVFSIKFVKTLQIPIIFEWRKNFYINLTSIIMCILSVGFIFIEATRPIVLLLFCISLMLTIFEIIKIKLEDRFGVILLIVSFIVSLLIFLLFSTKIIPPFQIILFEIMILISNFYIIYSQMKERQK